jgi:hypothetical protein
MPTGSHGQKASLRLIAEQLTISERVYRDQHMANVGLIIFRQPVLVFAHNPAVRKKAIPYINLVVFEPEFQIVVDGLVGNLAKPSKI